MKEVIQKYKLAWDIGKHSGHIKLKTNEGVHDLNFANAGDFYSVATIVQHEAPVYYDPQDNSVYCGTELVED